MSIGARPTRRIVASLAVLIGAFLLTVSVLIPTYAVDRLVKIPLTVEADTVSTGTATLLDSTELMQGRLVLEDDVPITVNQRVTVEDPSDKDVVTLQSAIRMTRDDRSGTAAIVNASVDRSTLDRTTALPVDEPWGQSRLRRAKCLNLWFMTVFSSSSHSTHRSSRIHTSTPPSSRAGTYISSRRPSWMVCRSTGSIKKSNRLRWEAASPCRPLCGAGKGPDG